MPVGPISCVYKHRDHLWSWRRRLHASSCVVRRQSNYSVLHLGQPHSPLSSAFHQNCTLNSKTGCWLVRAMATEHGTNEPPSASETTPLLHQHTEQLDFAKKRGLFPALFTAFAVSGSNYSRRRKPTNVASCIDIVIVQCYSSSVSEADNDVASC